MSKDPIGELRENLAAIEHERWADWQKYLHSRLRRHNGVKGQCKPGMLMSPTDYLHWEEQIAAEYSGLSEREKDSDREQVDRYWPLIEAYVQSEVVKELEKLDDEHQTTSQDLEREQPGYTQTCIPCPPLWERIKQLNAAKSGEEKE